MTRPCAALASLLLALAAAACAGATPPRLPSAGPAASDTAGALAAQREWWRAFAVADTAYVRAHTAPAVSVTLSSGLTLDLAGTVAQVATHVNGSRLGMAWAEEAVRLASPSVAIATARLTESEGTSTTTFRYLTVLERAGGGWRVAAAQSTRELAFTPRLAAAQAGPLGDYAGAYRTPRGTELRVLLRDSALVLVEPSGTEIPLAPVGPGIFEFNVLSPLNGVVRMMFTRDAGGRVASLSRLVPGQVITFPRIP